MVATLLQEQDDDRQLGDRRHPSLGPMARTDALEGEPGRTSGSVA